MVTRRWILTSRVRQRFLVWWQADLSWTERMPETLMIDSRTGIFVLTPSHFTLRYLELHYCALHFYNFWDGFYGFRVIIPKMTSKPILLSRTWKSISFSSNVELCMISKIVIGSLLTMLATSGHLFFFIVFLWRRRWVWVSFLPMVANTLGMGSSLNILKFLKQFLVLAQLEIL